MGWGAYTPTLLAQSPESPHHSMLTVSKLAKDLKDSMEEVGILNEVNEKLRDEQRK